MLRPFTIIFTLCFLPLIISCFFPQLLERYVDDVNVMPFVPSGALAPPPPRRTLLSIENPSLNTSLVATQDGAIHLLETDSQRVIWSFQSGPPIYSSYHAPFNSSDLSNGFFLDYGDDWEIYVHSRYQGQIKLQLTIEDFIRSTPQISEDGAVLLGSKTTTVFEVEANTGRLIHVYKLSDSPLIVPTNHENSSSYYKDTPNVMEADSIRTTTVGPRLHIMRTDYHLQSFAPNLDNILWNITVAEIGVVLLCQDDKNHLDVAPLTSKYDTISNYGHDFSMPLQCQSRAVVYRYRDHNMLRYSSRSEYNTRPLLPQEDSMVPRPASEETLPLRPKVEKTLDANVLLSGSVSSSLLPSLSRVGRKEKIYSLLMPLALPAGFSFVLFIGIFMGFIIYRHFQLMKGEISMNDYSGNHDPRSSPTKRKKIRRAGETNADRKENQDSSEDSLPDNTMLLNLNKHVGGDAVGRQIGKLLVWNTEIAKGSNGTIVFEGIYEGHRPVAVKRLVRAHHDVAFKEIQHLMRSDQHPNIVRWYGVEYDKDFVYLSLERCSGSLADLIQINSDHSQTQVSTAQQGVTVRNEDKVKSDPVKKSLNGLCLWTEDGHPSPLLMKLMRDVVSGLVHLHDLGIIHRDLKPQNVLIVEETLCAKLSDMGISKQLTGEMSSLSYHASGSGSSGWQAPEQLLHGRQTRAVDLFSLGCVIFYCITGGRHPFGTHLERDINIVKNKMDLFLVEHIPEVVDLLTHLLNSDPTMRPKAVEVLHHPFFWSYEMRLSFLRETSDRVELEDRDAYSAFLKELEYTALKSLGGKWNEKMEPAFINNIGFYRRYKYDSVRDLLRVMRNKLNHYQELPKHIQELLGSVPEGFYLYFARRFPRLFIEVYRVVRKYCKEEECFQKYFKYDVTVKNPRVKINEVGS